jgi:DDRGK domain-containing protein 1
MHSCVQKKKVVVLEELASEFGLRTQDAVDRVTKLAESKRITGELQRGCVPCFQDRVCFHWGPTHRAGVIDDRGKFIYITPAEMAKVAMFVGIPCPPALLSVSCCGEQVANFIWRRGRVTLAGLAAESNKLIDLTEVSQ